MRMLPFWSLSNLGIQIAASLFQVPPDIIKSQLPMAAPLPTSLAQVAHRKAVDDLMSDEAYPTTGYAVFDDDDNGNNVVNDKMDNDLGKGDHKPSTYGEVTTVGARQLFYHMGMTTTSNAEDDEIVFMDMGSGVGKLVVQAFLELPRCSKAIGVELAPQRHQYAVEAWDELESSARSLREETAPEDCTVEFLEGDIFEADISQATHLYIASLCFSQGMMQRLYTKLEQEGSPDLQCVATLRALPGRRKGLRDRTNYEWVMKALGMIESTELVEMSWTRDLGNQGCEVVIYTKSECIW